MKFIIEFDGPIGDIASSWHKAHEEAAAAVGWSRLDRLTFWSTMRSQGREGVFLRGAKPMKLKEYQKRFDERVEADEVVAMIELRSGAQEALGALARHGLLSVVTLGGNGAARWQWIEKHGLSRFFAERNGLDADPRRRPGQLGALAAGDPRTIVVASSDSLIRAADSAELFTLGLSCGACAPARLHRAGARVVFGGLKELVDCLRGGGVELVRAGLLPIGMG